MLAAPLLLGSATDWLTLAVRALRSAMYVWFVVVSMYMSVAGVFVHWPMGLSYRRKNYEWSCQTFQREDTNRERRVVCQSSVDSVSNSKIHGNLEQVMLQDNETDGTMSFCVVNITYRMNSPGGDDTGVAEDSLEAVPLLNGSHLTASDTPIWTAHFRHKLWDATKSFLPFVSNF